MENLPRSSVGRAHARRTSRDRHPSSPQPVMPSTSAIALSRQATYLNSCFARNFCFARVRPHRPGQRKGRRRSAVRRRHVRSLYRPCRKFHQRFLRGSRDAERVAMLMAPGTIVHMEAAVNLKVVHNYSQRSVAGIHVQAHSGRSIVASLEDQHPFQQGRLRQIDAKDDNSRPAPLVDRQ